MKKRFRLILKFFLLLLIMYVFHFIDRIALEYSYTTNHKKDYPVYEDTRNVIHISLWGITLITAVLVLMDLFKEKKIIKNWKLNSFLLFLVISITSELPIYSCYTRGIFESFWKPFHFH